MLPVFSPELLDHLSQPVIYVRNDQIAYRNRAAAALLQGGEVSVHSILPPAMYEAYARFDGQGTLQLELLLGGRLHSAILRREGDFLVFLAQPEPVLDALNPNTLAIVAQTLRSAVSEALNTATPFFAALEEEEDESIQMQTAKLNREFYRMFRLSVNLSDTGRLLAGDFRPVFRETDLSGFFGPLLQEWQSLCETVGVSLQYHLPPLLSKVVMDRQMIERALLNLLSNALRYTPSGGSIELCMELTERNLRIRIRDNGEGMSADVLSSAFERFAHRDQLGDSRWGVGLGLHLVRTIANLHGGAVVINSAPGVGTTVILSVSRELQPSASNMLNSPIVNCDYAGGYRHSVLELADALPSRVYDTVVL